MKNAKITLTDVEKELNIESRIDWFYEIAERLRDYSERLF